MFRLIKSLFRPKPPVEFRDAEFGVLTMTSGMWNGQVERGGRTVRFCVSGTDTAPAAALLDGVRRIVERLSEIEPITVAFLRAQDPSVLDGDFRFQGVDFPWEDKPDSYVMEFTLAGDEHVWRVEFEEGEPKFVWPH